MKSCRTTITTILSQLIGCEGALNHFSTIRRSSSLCDTSTASTVYCSMPLAVYCAVSPSHRASQDRAYVLLYICYLWRKKPYISATCGEECCSHFDVPMMRYRASGRFAEDQRQSASCT
eukprot:1193255-Prorocentrum_minimum.AAC.2